MGDLRPLGSEKLQGMDKIKRIIEIASYNEVKKENIVENNNSDYSIQLSDGYTYGIVREKQGYIIKKGLNESELEYSEPMKHRKYFRSYSEAMKKLNLTAAELNRLHENKEGISLIGEQPEQKKKFVLKLPKVNTPDADQPATNAVTPTTPATPAPTNPSTDEVDVDVTADAGAPTDTEELDISTSPEDQNLDTGAPTGDEDTGETPPAPTSDEMGSDDEMQSDEEGEPAGPSGLKTIQKLTGRLSQKIRSFDKDKGLDSQDIKYVLNSIISALNLDNLDEDDRDDIISNFDESDEYGEEGPGELDFSDEEFESINSKFQALKERMKNNAKYFGLLKSRDKLRTQDLIWKNICKDLDWPYHPSNI
jgi:hypothetical protein